MPNDWTARIWAEFRAGNLTRAWRDALLTLATFRGHGGIIARLTQPWPPARPWRPRPSSERCMLPATSA